MIPVEHLKADNAAQKRSLHSLPTLQRQFIRLRQYHVHVVYNTHQDPWLASPLSPLQSLREEHSMRLNTRRADVDDYVDAESNPWRQSRGRGERWVG